jgi:hypothetical protein
MLLNNLINLLYKSKHENNLINKMTETESDNKMIIRFEEIDEILQQINTYTRKIEDAKVSLKILKERLPKDLQKYLAIQGKPIPKSKEEREKEMKIKSDVREKNKGKDFFETYQPKKEAIDKEIRDVVNKQKYDLDKVYITAKAFSLSLRSINCYWTTQT